MPPVALGFTIRLVEELAATDVVAVDAVARPKTPKTMRKTSLSGQMRNQVSGP